MSKYLIKIDEDALKGDPTDNHDCPVARGFKKAGFPDVSVGTLTVMPFGDHISITLPRWVSRKIGVMIGWDGVKEPFEFGAEVPERSDS